MFTTALFAIQCTGLPPPQPKCLPIGTNRNKLLFPSIIYIDIEKYPEYINEKLSCNIVCIARSVCLCVYTYVSECAHAHVLVNAFKKSRGNSTLHCGYLG